ncbi:transcription initiation factor TFIIH subunit 3, variant [Blastomyces dermatitidis ATCC 18188]|uniref:General transcription and DNA repair factor IIH subunit TFB4 n=1 Tax=Ajellomyces dermatitidis (strain ATCC 18188 / CBS 674.68) TaxID=653446 RepID=F2TEP6_AJEDA|nr:transcription initiation factor TFIIH subunit 3 [Blastomyces dermatitidis ATCC 18188]KMW67581.1 transcription initiation factor TFIIH subunit 3, variant [Blastomyces dermatitidis ATCC 18188]
MNAVDGATHYDPSSNNVPAPSLLTVILDTNPHAWARLEPSLPFSAAIANLLVFINAHLACNYANKVAVVASHCHHATWLYPTPSTPPSSSSDQQTTPPDRDVIMNGQPSPEEYHQQGKGKEEERDDDDDDEEPINKYRPFRLVEEQLTRNLHALLSTTTSADISSTTSTMIAGALTLALSHINRETIAHAETHGTAKPDGTSASTSTSTGTTASGLPPPPGTTPATSSPTPPHLSNPTALQSRILIISLSSTTHAAQHYIPIMNSIFACQRLHIPIDILKLAGDAAFLQQASDATRGIYIPVTSHPAGFLQYLMLGFLPDQRARAHLVLPSRVDVDFRAACFCHRRVVDVGFVCSICLSIFCEPLGGVDGVAECLTCGSQLGVGEYAVKPVVVAGRKRKRKKEKGVGGKGGVSPGSATPTPTPGAL